MNRIRALADAGYWNSMTRRTQGNRGEGFAETRFCPAWPVLSPAMFARPRNQSVPYPLNAPVRRSFYLARNAIFHLFRMLGLRDDQQVLVPDYHSGNEVSAIRAAGARIRFYRIRRNLQPDMDQLETLSRAGARVLYVIHFIGWPQPLAELSALCARTGMLLVEDCALALLSGTRENPVGTCGEYSIYCLYKTLPLPNGGLLVQNRSVLQPLQEISLRRPGRLSVAGRISELALAWLRGRSRTIGGALARLKGLAGRILTSMSVHRVAVGDIGFDPKHLDLGMSKICGSLLARFDYDAIRDRRRTNYLHMQQRLAGNAPMLCHTLDDAVCPLFFPILVQRKHESAEALRARGIQAVELWNYGDPEVPRAASADAQFLRDHVLELPIHQGISDDQVDYIAGEVLRLGLRGV
jgi:dTDP-4-amino-4,6-dideoxygalactose transaminase